VVIRFKNIRKIAVLLCVEFVLIGIVVYTITTSFFSQESFIVKNSQVDTMYENWLILRTSVFSYVTSPSPGRSAEQERLVRDFEEFDFSMVQISDDKTFNKIERQYPQVHDIRQVLVYNWQITQYKLTELLQAGENLNEFATLVLWIARDTQEMDRFFGLLRHFCQQVNRWQQRTNLLVSYAIVVIFIFISSFAIYRNARIEHRLEREEEMQKMAKTLIHIRDDERKRIAMDIHDSLVHRLRELKGYTDIVLTDSHKDHISSEISAIIDEARDISFNLIPFISSGEAGEDFVDVIKSYAAEILMAKDIQFAISSTGFNKISLPEDMRISMFRIIQETLNNVVKYAEASKVTMKFIYSYPFVMFSVADDGVGLPDSSIGRGLTREHIGFYGMQERVKYYNGTFTVNSQPNKGTKISVRIPFKGKDNG
jgi:signal transduction histidine kinase